MRGLAFVVLLFLAAPAWATVTIDWATVGDPGNGCDTQPQGCFGAVAYTYQVGKYEVTNNQYAEFLNAMAATDTNELYNVNMGRPDLPDFGGITRSGSPGSYTYNTVAGRGDMPVNFVDFYDSLRFANWLHNGQPTGAQDNTTTEDGSYTITAGGIASNSITRNAGATIVLTSEDEWHKAAYYDALTTNYFDYPTGTDTQTICVTPGAHENGANCAFAVGDLTDVGSYTRSVSPSGTFDQGGSVWEWNEEIMNTPDRGIRSGSFLDGSPNSFSASFRAGIVAEQENASVGFRVAMVPEPSTALLFTLGLVGIAAGRRAAR